MEAMTDASEDALERAAAFVSLHGDALSRMRAQGLVGGVTAPALALLDAEQEPAHLDAALRVLGICDDLRALGTPLVSRIAVRLGREQRPDGSWGDGEDGDDARLFRSGMLAGYLAKTRFARPETLAAAGDYLAAHFSPERLQGFQWGNIAAYAHYYSNALHEHSDEVLQWCGRELERGFRLREFDAVRTARVLVYCDAHSLPGAQFASGELGVALLTEQAPDGSFSPADAGDAPATRVAYTLDGLVALARLGGRDRC
jgi:hypothetical protein